jgi:hypothetical protein
MSFATRDRLYELLPAVYRQRDADAGFPLRDLVAVLAREAAVVEGDIEELYASWFIETCAEWVVPYLGDLIGVTGVSGAGQGRLSRRAEVANTLSLRQRKGTAAVLEQLARDVTGWPARAVEFFELLATNQHGNHVRLHSKGTVDLRRAEALELLSTPFSDAARTLEARRIEPRRGRFNIPNVGLFLWRLQAYPVRLGQPHRVAAGESRFTFSPLGNDLPLFHLPRTETEESELAGELNVPGPIRRRAFHARPEAYYGSSFGLFQQVAGEWQLLSPAAVDACDLTDWSRPIDTGRIAIDPALGRIKFGADAEPAGDLRVSYHYGFSADLGGGAYERGETFSQIAGAQTFEVGPGDPQAEFLAAVEDALAALAGNTAAAVILIPDSRTYPVVLASLPAQTIELPAARHLEIRAANGQRPTLRLGHPLRVDGAAGSSFELQGLLVADQPVEITGEVDRLTVSHTTLVPGLALLADGAQASPGAPSLEVASGTTEVRLERSILGGLRMATAATVTIRDSVVDAQSAGGIAYGAPDPADGGGALTLSRCTVVGRIHCLRLDLAENSLFLAPVIAEQKQQGCVRFSHVPRGSRVPRRFRCQPVIPAEATAAQALRIAARVFPRFTSLAYGSPAYGQLAGQLSGGEPVEILRGSEEESEMGVFSSLLQPQREDSLRARLDEYLRLGLEAGIFTVT